MKPKKASSAKLATSAAVATSVTARRCETIRLKSHLALQRSPIQHSSDFASRGMQASQAPSKNSPTTAGAPKNPFIYICAGCNKPIRRDKFLLKACEKYWHENCLKCDRCHSRLGELGSTLFFKSNMNLCRQDYLEMFGETGVCSVCEQRICASEMVMRAKQNVYHLECFACQLCNQRFCVGDRFYLCENKVVCQYDYEEHILPIQKSLLEQQSAIASNCSQSSTSNYARQAMPSVDHAAKLNDTPLQPEPIHQLNLSDTTSAATLAVNAMSCVDLTPSNEQSLEVGPRLQTDNAVCNRRPSQIDVSRGTTACLSNIDGNHHQGRSPGETGESQAKEEQSEELSREGKDNNEDDDDCDERNSTSSVLEILVVVEQESTCKEQATSNTSGGPETDQANFSNL